MAPTRVQRPLRGIGNGPESTLPADLCPPVDERGGECPFHMFRSSSSEQRILVNLACGVLTFVSSRMSAFAVYIPNKRETRACEADNWCAIGVWILSLSVFGLVFCFLLQAVQQPKHSATLVFWLSLCSFCVGFELHMVLSALYKKRSRACGLGPGPRGSEAT